jgi:hypothetical protein
MAETLALVPKKYAIASAAAAGASAIVQCRTSVTMTSDHNPHGRTLHKFSLQRQ